MLVLFSGCMHRYLLPLFKRRLLAASTVAMLRRVDGLLLSLFIALLPPSISGYGCVTVHVFRQCLASIFVSITFAVHGIVACITAVHCEQCNLHRLCGAMLLLYLAAHVFKTHKAVCVIFGTFHSTRVLNTSVKSVFTKFII